MTTTATPGWPFSFSLPWPFSFPLPWPFSFPVPLRRCETVAME
jgi:hypothetical protein